MVKLKQKDTGFTMVSNKPLCNKDLSLSAKGLYAYLRSKPDGWQFSADRIALDCLECVRTIKSILQELEDFGLLIRKRKSDGRIDYFIQHKPQCKICTVKNLHGEEFAPISNTELNNNTEYNNNTYSFHQDEKITSNNKYPIDWYQSVIDEYQRLKEISLNGKEKLPVMATIKRMFQSERTPEQIIDCMRFFTRSTNECWAMWNINTVAKQLPLFLAGKL